MPRGGKPKIRRPYAGRPEKPIDWKLVDKLMECGCTGTQIAARLDLHYQTFYDRVAKEKNCNYTEYAASKNQRGETLLLEKQFDTAMEGDRTLLIWLGKNRLKQVDKQPDEKATETLGLLHQIIAKAAGNESEPKPEASTDNTGE